MPKDGSDADDRNPSVLDGPKFPYWGCSNCGSASNSASRIRCRCGTSAPTRIVQAAKRNVSLTQPRPSNPRRAQGDWPRGPPSHKPGKMAELEKEVRELKQKLGQTSSPTNVEIEETDDLQSRIVELSNFWRHAKDSSQSPNRPDALKLRLKKLTNKIMNQNLCGRKHFGWD